MVKRIDSLPEAEQLAIYQARQARRRAYDNEVRQRMKNNPDWMQKKRDISNRWYATHLKKKKEGTETPQVEGPEIESPGVGV